MSESQSENAEQDIIAMDYGNLTMSQYVNPLPIYTRDMADLSSRASQLYSDLAIIADLAVFIPYFNPDALLRRSESRILQLLSIGYFKPIFNDDDLFLYGRDYINAKLNDQREMELAATNSLALRYAQFLASSMIQFQKYITDPSLYEEQFDLYNSSS